MNLLFLQQHCDHVTLTVACIVNPPLGLAGSSIKHTHNNITTLPVLRAGAGTNRVAGRFHYYAHFLRHELYHIQRELLKERTRCKALEEELENPMNIHRWRKLEGSDPSTYEMIQKIHTLQRRLIQKTEEVIAT